MLATSLHFFLASPSPNPLKFNTHFESGAAQAIITNSNAAVYSSNQVLNRRNPRRPRRVLATSLEPLVVVKIRTRSRSEDQPSQRSSAVLSAAAAQSSPKRLLTRVTSLQTCHQPP